MRVLVTGANGFVGPHVVSSLRHLSPQVDILATNKVACAHASIGSVNALDIVDRAAVDDVITRYGPTHIVHLAGIAAPMAAVADPRAAWRVNVEGALNLAHSILKNAPRCNLLFVGSGLVYGASARSGLALDETTLLDPMDEYAATKAAADLALGALARRGLKCIRLRPFNHAGPGQDEAFALPSFAMQIARIEAGLLPPVIRVGNLDRGRDLLDVRDVASAYTLAVAKADTLAPGTILNIASGTAYRMRDLLDRLLALSSVQISVEQDPTRMRPVDIERIAGDASLARRLLGWAPAHDIGKTLADILDDARARVSRSS